jgi:two-component system OmpR family sensor kinase
VIGTAVLGTIGVRLGMRPLDRVTRTARTVAAELGPDGSGLENRVPDADPHTEVGQLAEAVNTMLDAVEQEYTARYESEQRLRRFLADASHELRTPLTSLRGYAELVRMRGGLDPEASDSLRRIEAEGTRMSGLVEDLLTLARSDRGTIAERVPVDVAEVVDDAVAGLRAAYPHRQVAVTHPGPLVVLGDRNQLLQVVTNILTNAAVHATAPVPITVTAGQEDNEVVLRVVDAGPGLPPEQAALVFDRFWRADAARTRARGGSGLGMSIVAALVADHGGRVDFESTVEHGTTVTVRLPAASRPAETLSSEATPPVSAPVPR